MTPPIARVEVVRDTYFGVTIEDPYRWMEDSASDEARGWLSQQASDARRILGGLPERARLLAGIADLGDVSAELTNPRLAGGRAFYMRRDAESDLACLVVRDGLDAAERTLVDPAVLSGVAHMSIDWYEPSPDGRWVAYGISEGGSENSTLNVLEVDTADALEDRISGVVFPFVSWMMDGSSFVYHRYPEPRDDAPAAERRFDSKTFLHTLGDDPDHDRAILGRGLNEAVELDPVDRPFVLVPTNSAWMVGVISHSAVGYDEWTDCTFYVAPIAAAGDPATCPWQRVATVDDGVRNFTLDGDTLYLVTRRNSPRYEVLAVALPDGDLAHARVVVPASDRVIEDVCVAGDFLLTRELSGGVGRIRRRRLSGGEPADVVLPVDGTVLGWASDPNSDDAILCLTSWTVPPRAYLLDLRSGAVADAGWVAQPPTDLSAITAYQVQATARDGTLVPLSIVHQRDQPRDGNRPTMITAYGSYGASFLPFFRPELLPWYEQGGIWAVAHVRGGGELGREWHEAGYKLNKENTITDLIDCAEYLIAEGYTRPARLACEGGSAGGIPSGGALVRRPDLWAAVVMHVALTNPLRFELGENGPINIPEFGTVTDEIGFQSLQIIDSYSKVQQGVSYPAVLLTTGLNDPRMDVWQATKMVARLQAATTSRKPILLRVTDDGGHGMGATKHQLDELLADQLAFLTDQFEGT